MVRVRLRAKRHGLAQVRFVEGDIHDPAPGSPLDAIVERLALMYVPHPAGVLRRQATVLRPGGLVVPIEFDFATARALPATPLANQAVFWLVEAFTKGGDQSLGPRLWSVLLEAGLQPFGMMGVQPHFGPGDPGWSVPRTRSQSASAPLYSGIASAIRAAFVSGWSAPGTSPPSSCGGPPQRPRAQFRAHGTCRRLLP